MGILGFLKNEKLKGFEMVIDDIFTIQNHGVIVTGKINHGEISTGDSVLIGKKKYTVSTMDAVTDPATRRPSPVTGAKEGTNVALHLATMNSDHIKKGDIVRA